MPRNESGKLPCVGLVLVAFGCAPATPGRAVAETPPTADPSDVPPPASTEPEPPAAPSSTPELGPFVRKRPESQPSGVDACAYRGFMGAACIDALLAEPDPVKRRYMRRLSDGAARIEHDNRAMNDWGGVAHAEMVADCGKGGPCGRAIPGSGGKPDDGYACLTKAEALLNDRKKPSLESKQAHARACQCDPTRAQIPAMGGVLACDGPGKPVEHGTQLDSIEAQEIVTCGVCDPVRGPAACTKEIDRLSSKDPELADYIRKTHAPRCQKP